MHMDELLNEVAKDSSPGGAAPVSCSTSVFTLFFATDVLPSRNDLIWTTHASDGVEEDSMEFQKDLSKTNHLRPTKLQSSVAKLSTGEIGNPYRSRTTKGRRSKA
jgi:hypothetical protein